MIIFNILSILLMPLSQNQNNSIVVQNISSILEYYEKEESIHHSRIGLYSDLLSQDFEPILQLLKKEFPEHQINYHFLETNSKQFCQNSNSDLIIVIPSNIFKANSGVYQYNFQSRIKNVFGTMKIEVNLGDGILKTRNKQFFTTSIGNL